MFSSFGNLTSQPLGQSTNPFQTAQQQQQQQLIQQQQQQQVPLYGPPRQPTLQDQITYIKEAWDPQSPNCVFKHYFYNVVHPSEVKNYTRPLDHDPNLWEQATKNNPDPSCLVPALCVGYAGVKRRIEQQESHIQNMNARLNEISVSFDRIRTLHEVDTQCKLADYRRRHQELSARLLRLMRTIHVLRSHNHPLRPEEEQFCGRLESLILQLRKPGQYKSAVQDLWTKAQLSNGRAGGAQSSDMDVEWKVVDEEQLNRVHKLLSDQQQALLHVTEMLKKDAGDLEPQPPLGYSMSEIECDAANPPTAVQPSPSLIFRLRHSRTSVGLLAAFCIFADMVVYAAVIPIFPSIVNEQLHMNTTHTGLLVGIYAAGLLLFTPIFGRISDKFNDKKYCMLVSLAGLVISTVIFAYSTKYWHLIVARVVQGVAAAGNWTVALAMANDVYPADSLGSVMGIVLSAMNLGYMVGPAIGGLLYDSLGFKAPFFFGGGLVLLALLARLFVDERHATLPKLPIDLDSGKHMDANMWTLFQHPPVWVNCLVIMALGAVNAGLEPSLPRFLTDNFGTSVGTNGLIFLGIAIPGLITSPIAGRLCDRFSPRKIQLISLCAFVVVVPFVGVPRTLALAVTMLVLYGFAFAVVAAPSLIDMGIFVQAHYPHCSAQVYAFFCLAYSSAMFIGPITSSALYDALSFFWSLVVFAGLLVLVTVVYVWYLRSQPAETIARAAAATGSDELAPTTPKRFSIEEEP
ncbi:hypothetical protein RI367_002055 [Sorochytrium milnesiophthora]